MIVVREHHIPQGGDSCETDRMSSRKLGTPWFSPCLRVSVVNLESFERDCPELERGATVGRMHLMAGTAGESRE